MKILLVLLYCSYFICLKRTVRVCIIMRAFVKRHKQAEEVPWDL